MSTLTCRPPTPWPMVLEDEPWISEAVDKVVKAVQHAEEAGCTRSDLEVGPGANAMDYNLMVYRRRPGTGMRGPIST